MKSETSSASITSAPPTRQLRATLHALRDRLPPELVAHFGAELPMLVRRIYYDGWHPSVASLKAAHDKDFFDSMAGELRGHDELEDIEAAAGAVLSVVNRRLALGRIDPVFDALPEKVRRAWCGLEEDEDIQ
jgi:uncharacterized protein (DUF2267 family)